MQQQLEQLGAGGGTNGSGPASDGAPSSAAGPASAQPVASAGPVQLAVSPSLSRTRRRHSSTGTRLLPTLENQQLPAYTPPGTRATYTAMTLRNILKPDELRASFNGPASSPQGAQQQHRSSVTGAPPGPRSLSRRVSEDCVGLARASVRAARTSVGHESNQTTGYADAPHSPGLLGAALRAAAGPASQPLLASVQQPPSSPGGPAPPLLLKGPAGVAATAPPTAAGGQQSSAASAGPASAPLPTGGLMTATLTTATGSETVVLVQTPHGLMVVPASQAAALQQAADDGKAPAGGASATPPQVSHVPLCTWTWRSQLSALLHLARQVEFCNARLRSPPPAQGSSLDAQAHLFSRRSALVGASDSGQPQQPPHVPQHAGAARRTPPPPRPSLPPSSLHRSSHRCHRA